MRQLLRFYQDVSWRARFLVVLVVVALLANGVLAVGWTLPAWHILARGEGRYTEVRRELVALVREAALRQAHARAIQDMQKVREHLVLKKDVPGMVEHLHRLARKDGARITAATYAPEPVKELGLTRLSLTLPVEGPYPALRRFLWDLEGFPVLLAVESCLLRRGSHGRSMVMELKLLTYVDGGTTLNAK